MRYEILQTGSDGNCTIINGQIAIDIGVTQTLIEPHVPDLKLVLLTHRHSDHFNKSTVKAMAKARPTLRWACCEWMVEPLLDAGVLPRNIDALEPERWYTYGDLAMVQAFRTPHNVENCGWRVLEHGQRLLYATDLGYIPEGLTAQHYDFYLLEANHTTAEIEAAVAAAEATGEYSYRIKAAENHLSQEQAIDWLTENMGPNSIWVPMHQHKEKERNGDGREADDLQQDYGP